MADSVLLDKIDQLSLSGVGDCIPMPRIVVVGDRSSGKSSVLESLTAVPFPRGDSFCTWFATEIIFRRAQELHISVLIVPGANRDAQYMAKCKAWAKTDLTALTPESFSELVTEAHDLMQLHQGRESSKPPRLSEDILRFEVSGPQQHHFSIVDLPGIPVATTEGAAATEDVVVVKNMINRYICDPSTIILAVAPANVDIASQRALSIANAADPTGHRTVGVLTKPDLVEEGAEGPAMQLLNGKWDQMALGWCVLHMADQTHLKDASAARAQAEDEFFRIKAPWHMIDQTQVGIGALRQRLQDIVTTSFRQEFSTVRTNINARLRKAQTALQELGEQRRTSAGQIQYLMPIGTQFQAVANAALEASYGASDWFDQYPNLRFATTIANRHKKVERFLRLHGHTFSFTGCTGRSSYDSDDSDTEEDFDADGGLMLQSLPNIAGLRPLPEYNVPLRAGSTENIMPWLREVCRASQGFELGASNRSILSRAMKKQSEYWEPIALSYISDVINLAHTFVSDLLLLLCPNRRVYDGLLSVLMEVLLTQYQRAIDHVRFLLDIERKGNLIALDRSYTAASGESHETPVRNRGSSRSNVNSRVDLFSHSLGFPDTPPTTPERKKAGSPRRTSVVAATRDVSEFDHRVQGLHDQLSSYYQVARKRFTDNLCMQAADHYLVSGPDSPLRLLCPEFIAKLSIGQLDEIAGEDATIKQQRSALEKEIAILEAGKLVLA